MSSQILGSKREPIGDHILQSTGSSRGSSLSLLRNDSRFLAGCQMAGGEPCCILLAYSTGQAVAAPRFLFMEKFWRLYCNYLETRVQCQAGSDLWCKIPNLS